MSGVCHEPGSPRLVRTSITNIPSAITAISFDIPGSLLPFYNYYKFALFLIGVDCYALVEL